MTKRFRFVLAWAIKIIGTFLALFIGVYVLFIIPILELINSLSAGTLTKTLLLVCIVKVFFASTVGGFIWCLFDIISSHIKGIVKE